MSVSDFQTFEDWRRKLYNLQTWQTLLTFVVNSKQNIQAKVASNIYVYCMLRVVLGFKGSK